MSAQPSLFDMLRAPPIIRSVDPDGPVVQGEPDETLTLPHPRLAWDRARIELHRHSDGTWMWSVGTGGGGYRVGEKWGRFAETRDDALHYAVQELLEQVERAPAGPINREIACWAERLQ